jgi:Secretion system C-terminal sorting domain
MTGKIIILKQHKDMKKLILILVLALFSFLTNAWSQENNCPAPTPYVSTSSATSCTLKWDNVANNYLVEVYEAGTSNIIQTLQTSENFITISNLDPNLSYEAVVYSICGDDKSPSVRIPLLLVIITDDPIMIMIRFDPSIFIKTDCKTVLTETCFSKKGGQMTDLMQYGGSIFTVRTPSGYVQEWQCTIANNELIFRNSARSNGIAISTIRSQSNPNSIVGIAFSDALGTPLWTLREARNATNQVTFDLQFETAACLTIENCVTTVTYTPTECEQNPKFCEEGKFNSGGSSTNITAFTVSPNPVTDIAILTLNLREQEAVSVAIYDVSGKLIQTLQQGILDRGAHRFTWESAAILRGLYFVEVKTPTQHFFKKIIKL